MNATWQYVRPFHEQEEFDAEHGTPGMAKTLGFHMKAFREPLPVPGLWHHADVYPAFDVWGYSVQTDRQTSGFTLLENVYRSGFRSSVREWLPDGRLLPSVTVRISTGPVYAPGKAYRVTDVNRSSGEVRHIRTKSDSQGRLHFRLDGDVHEIGISEDAAPILTLAGWRIVNAPRATAGPVPSPQTVALEQGRRRGAQCQGQRQIARLGRNCQDTPDVFAAHCCRRVRGSP